MVQRVALHHPDSSSLGSPPLQELSDEREAKLRAKSVQKERDEERGRGTKEKEWSLTLDLSRIRPTRTLYESRKFESEGFKGLKRSDP